MPFVFTDFIELAQGPKSPPCAGTPGRVTTLARRSRVMRAITEAGARTGARGSSEDSVFTLGAKSLHVFGSALVRFLVLSFREVPFHGEGLKLRKGWKILQ